MTPFHDISIHPLTALFTTGENGSCNTSHHVLSQRNFSVDLLLKSVRAAKGKMGNFSPIANLCLCHSWLTVSMIFWRWHGLGYMPASEPVSLIFPRVLCSRALEKGTFWLAMNDTVTQTGTWGRWRVQGLVEIHFPGEGLEWRFFFPWNYFFVIHVHGHLR